MIKALLSLVNNYSSGKSQTGSPMETIKMILKFKVNLTKRIQSLWTMDLDSLQVTGLKMLGQPISIRVHWETLSNLVLVYTIEIKRSPTGSLTVTIRMISRFKVNSIRKIQLLWTMDSDLHPEIGLRTHGLPTSIRDPLETSCNLEQNNKTRTCSWLKHSRRNIQKELRTLCLNHSIRTWTLCTSWWTKWKKTTSTPTGSKRIIHTSWRTSSTKEERIQMWWTSKSNTTRSTTTTQELKLDLPSMLNSCERPNQIRN